MTGKWVATFVDGKGDEVTKICFEKGNKPSQALIERLQASQDQVADWKLEYIGTWKAITRKWRWCNLLTFGALGAGFTGLGIAGVDVSSWMVLVWVGTTAGYWVLWSREKEGLR